MAKISVPPFSILLTFICVSLVGLCFIPLLNIKIDTKTTEKLNVQYYWIGTSPRVIEQEVTAKLEGIFSAVKGLRYISSVSGKGYGRIEMTFKKNVNMDAMRFEVATLVRQAHPTLPEQVSYPEISFGVSTGELSPLMTYTFVGNEDPYHIQKYAEKNVLPKLHRIKGIGDVRVYGASPFHWRIELKVEVLKSLGLRSDDIVKGINQYFLKAFIGKGNYGSSERNFVNETTLLFQSNAADEVRWEDIPVKKFGERVVFLNEVATIRFEEQLPSEYYRVNGRNAINIVIFPETGINTIELAKEIKTHFKQIRKQLPVGYSFLLVNDTTKNLVKELEKMTLRSLVSLVILIAFVLTFTRDMKYMILVLVSIMVCLSCSMVLFYFLRVELNWYSLAGVTISYGYITGNSIMMIHHYLHNGQKKIFTAILGTALCTIGAMVIVFLLKEEQQVNLKDFTSVITVNILVSLIVSLFFIPAWIKKFQFNWRIGRVSWKRRRALMEMSLKYSRYITFSKRNKVIFILVLLLGFGIPIHLLPSKIKGTDSVARIYNETLGNEVFEKSVKPHMEKVLGGSFRLFMKQVFEKAYYADPDRTSLNVYTRMTHGSSVKQHSEALSIIENYVNQFNQVEICEATVSGSGNGRISIQFLPSVENGVFPHKLKQELESLVSTVGSVDAMIYGVGIGFSNGALGEMRNTSITLEGYNYEQLYSYASQLKQSLSRNSHVKDIVIAGSSEWDPKVDVEYSLELDAQQLSSNNVTSSDLYSYLSDEMIHTSMGDVYINGEMQKVTVVSDVALKIGSWDFKNEPILVANNQYKIWQLGKINKQRDPAEIHKFDQQYHLVVAYNFVGNFMLSDVVSNEAIKKISSVIPAGYRVFRQENISWDRQEKSQYYLILLVVVVIYFISSILLESLLQPLAIIAIVPVSFIGIFLTFYLFNFDFDQGGFASFILLCGTAVSCSLYIVNDFNNFVNQDSHREHLSLYLKAFHHKIGPVCLTTMSTILGLIVFVYNGQHEVFWFAFAAGVIGGLLFSLVGILIFLPLFLKLEKGDLRKAQPRS